MIQLKVLSPEAVLIDREVDAVTLPGALSPFQVLKDHAPLISPLEKGEIVWRAGETEGRLTITSGFVEVLDNTVSACVER